jgi:hypothetical protein
MILRRSSIKKTDRDVTFALSIGPGPALAESITGIDDAAGNAEVLRGMQPRALSWFLFQNTHDHILSRAQAYRYGNARHRFPVPLRRARLYLASILLILHVY